MTFLVNQLIGFGASPPPPALTFLQAATDSADATTYSFASQNFGSAHPNRFLIATFGWAAGANPTGSSCTIGGITASKAVEVVPAVSSGGACIFIARVPSGTSGTVAITLTGGAVRMALGLYAATDLRSETPTATSSHNAAVSGVTSGTIAVQGQGIVVGTAFSIDAVSGYTWTGLTKDNQTSVEAGVAEFSCASGVFASTQASLSWSAQDGAAATRSPFGAVAAFR
jgi:hypothetical protein